MLKVEEIKSIKVTIDMTPDEWDPSGQTGPDTTRWHKAKLLNQRVAKFAPTLGAVEFYLNIARFAHEQGFGDTAVIVKVTEYIYSTRLVFEEEQAA